MLQPIYTPANTTPAYQLNWGITIFWRDIPIPEKDWLEPLKDATGIDGVRILKHRTTNPNGSQLFVSTTPFVSPSQILRSLKGRLQNLIRDRQPKAFQRNYDVHSIGSANRETIEHYVADQLGHHKMADPVVNANLKQFQKDFNVDLSVPQFSAHGRYAFNLHLVLVNTERWHDVRVDLLQALAKMIERSALKHKYRLSKAAILTDHLHLTTGCSMSDVPGEVALTFLNNCAFALGMKPVFKFSYFVGTFGEYDRGAV